jgi:WD40 repeat protein
MILTRFVVTLAVLMCATLVSSAQEQGASGPLPILRIETGRHAAPVRRLSVSVARGLVVTASDDKTARVWDLDSGQLKLVLRPPIGAGEVGRLYGAAIHPSLALVAVGGTAAEAGGRGAIYLFALDSGRLVRVIDAGPGAIKRLTWSADGSVLLAGCSDPGGVRAFSLDGRPLYAEATEGPVYAVAAGSGGLVAATDLAGRVLLLHAAAGAVGRAATLVVKPLEPWGVALSPDERQLVVGYRHFLSRPEVVDVASGQVVRQLQPQGAVEGNFGVVAWSRDGQTIAVAGSASLAGRRYPVWYFSAGAEVSTRSVEVAGNSVLDLAERGEGRFAYTSFDGSWGVVGTEPQLRVTSSVNDLRGAASLLASDDLRRISWTFTLGGERASFDLPQRGVGAALPGLAPALTRRSPLDAPLEAGFDAEGPAHTRSSVEFNGSSVTFTGVELGSCGTYLRGSRDAIIGTTRALYRFDATGKPVWRLPTAAEVDAVVASADGRLLVTAMSDGVIQWRRASDGTELLSLLVTRDRRWIVWTPEGYFDASAGADELAGWVVNRGAADAAELFSLGRFRDRYQRPDVVDHVLETLDTRTAIAEAAPSSRLAELAPQGVAPIAITAFAPTPTVSAPAPIAVVKAAPPADEFPPSLVAVAPRALRPTGSDLEIPFALRARASDSRAQIQIELRVDGRPVNATRVELPTLLDGNAVGRAALKIEPGSGTVVLLARDGAGFSEPLQFQITPAPVAASASASASAERATVQARSSLPKLYLLVVGISEYERPEYRLGLPAKDAADFSRVMTLQKGHSYSEVDARVLTDARASRQSILAGLKWLSDVVAPGDVGMLFIAGHGVNEHGGQYYFMGYDARAEQLQKTGVAERDIRDALRRIRGRAIFFVDTCFAGNVIGDPRTSGRELSRLANNLASAENGVIVFAASSGRQESEENAAWGNGAFTKALVEGLSGGADLNHVGRITFKGLDFFVSEEVRRLTKGRQTPVTIMPVGVPDFDIASRT